MSKCQKPQSHSQQHTFSISLNRSGNDLSRYLLQSETWLTVQHSLLKQGKWRCTMELHKVVGAETLESIEEGCTGKRQLWIVVTLERYCLISQLHEHSWTSRRWERHLIHLRARPSTRNHYFLTTKLKAYCPSLQSFIAFALRISPFSTISTWPQNCCDVRYRRTTLSCSVQMVLMNTN